MSRTLARRNRERIGRVVVVAVFPLLGAGTAAALALLPPDVPTAVTQELGLVSAAPAARGVAVGHLDAAGSTAGRAGADYYRETSSRHVAASAETGFLALYKEAARTFGVAWQLIASIHRQETAFSSVASTYHGLNAFGCCAGPMQFNVTNGATSTWDLYRESFRLGNRPHRYPHPTGHHPSVYDDFDAIMAAGALLRDSGAGAALDGGSWSAAYAYYGHDMFGVDYASQVVARARTWQRDGFCVNCALDESIVAELDALYGVDARRALRAAEREKDKKKHKKHRKRDRATAQEEARQRAKDRGTAPSASAGESEGGPSDPAAPAPPSTTTTPAATTPSSPATTTAPQPAAPPPPAAHTCSRLEKVLGCRDGTT